MRGRSMAVIITSANVSSVPIFENLAFMLKPHFSMGAHFIGGVKYIILFKDTIILGDAPSGEFTELNKLKFLKIPLPAATYKVCYKE